MRNNKAILDEAARSVRRTFIGSVAGSTVMLAVVGAAGAYGMPEKLTAHAFAAAMAKFNVTFAPKSELKGEHAEATIERPVRLADNSKIITVSPVAEVSDADTPQAVVVIAPPAPVVLPAAASSAFAKATPAVEPMRSGNPFAAADAAIVPVTTASIAPTPISIPAPAPVIAPVATVVATPAAKPVPKPDPARVLASLPVQAAEERPLLSAPMVFEAPKAADAQVLTALPKTEIVVAVPSQAVPQQAAPQQVEVPLPVPAPVQQASVAAEPSLDVFPKSVTIALPIPKPPLSPAQRLDLAGKDYDKAEKCLAQAIYFEARNEPARGQQAVAQVVLNRVFSPYYPKDVCSVVYQNAHRHLSCQFTFACDGKPEAINDRGSWARANRIATQTLNAKVWLPEVNKATHYHAAYVRPNWIRDMKVMVRYGLHTFYRPRNWGDGSDEAHWGTVANSVKPAAPTAAKPLTPAQRRFAYRRT